MSALRSSFTRSPHGLRPHGRDRHFPNIQGFRGYGSDSGHTPFTSLLLFVLPLAFAFSRYTTERLTRPYSGGPTRLRGFPLDRQPLPGYPIPPLPMGATTSYGPRRVPAVRVTGRNVSISLSRYNWAGARRVPSLFQGPSHPRTKSMARHTRSILSSSSLATRRPMLV